MINSVFFDKNKFTFLFLTVIFIIVVMPFLEGEYRIIAPLVLMVFMISVIGTLKFSRWLFVTCIVIGLSATILHIFVEFYPVTAESALTFKIILTSALISYILFLSICTGGLLVGILKLDKVTKDVIKGSISVYLLIGIIWALLYRMVYVLKPTEFAESILPGKFADFLYFSFTTLTTLGYGDISPLGPISRSLTTVEVIIGPIFLTVLVARLVSLHLTHTSEKI